MKYFNNDQKRQQTKTNEQTKNKQIALVLAELENDIQNFKITIQKKDEQLLKFSKLIKAIKTEYQKLHKKNADLKKYIAKKKHDQQKQQRYQHYQQQFENESDEGEAEEEENEN